MFSSKPGISVIISAYNSETLQLCLDGFRNQIDPPPFEICLINDGGNEIVTPEGVRTFYLFPPTRTYRLSKARNLGAKNATYTHLVFTDQDCIPAPNFLSCHYNSASNGLTVGLRRRIPFDEVPKIQTASDLLKVKWIDDERTSKLPQAKVDAISMIPLAFGCNIGVSLDLFNAVGGFDERFVGWGFEDLDFAARIYLRYRPIIIDEEIITYHLNHKSRSKDAIALTKRNELLYLKSYQKAVRRQPPI